MKTTGGTKTTYGAMTDRQGSLRALYNGSGLVQSFSYDAWGNRRNPSTGAALTTSELVAANSITSRGYTCHEHMDEFGLINMNARIYDPSLGMFISVDPLAQEYYNTYPYAYCGGDPVNAVDPTGKLIIFINGFHNGTQGAKPRYWETQSGKFDEAIMKHFKDDNKLYYDGSFGGIFGISSNIIMKNRFDMGYTVGLKEASDIIANLARDKDGYITESIKVVSHSMGGAYAKGFLTALMEYIYKYPQLSNGISIAEYDFAPFQSSLQKTVNGVDTYQYSHISDKIAGNDPIKGANIMETSDTKKHSLVDFYEYILNSATL